MPMRPTSPSRASRGQKGPKTMPCHTAECGWSRELGGGARKKLMQSGSSLFCLSALLCLSALFCLSALVCSPVTQRHSTLMRGMRVIRGIAIERIVVRLEVCSPQTTLRPSFFFTVSTLLLPPDHPQKGRIMTIETNKNTNKKPSPLELFRAFPGVVDPCLSIVASMNGRAEVPRPAPRRSGIARELALAGQGIAL